ncbi:CotY/CotZ family spore coat protein [Thalassorhabdus alkalitolerans]|uniref:CotY/CotZ family spore coat protein n=1 Tax=Thalassorhabdus alkalitolerans TaxID=2282697 RepID=A0ABW0YQU3_9BACI|nr:MULTISPECIES: CotY/CotZ family spore coat protein [Bacillaceae]
MGCGKKHDTGHCVCDAVAAIKDAQDRVRPADDCVNSCFTNLLSPKGRPTTMDTIPFILKDKKGDMFHAFGDIGGDDCFATVFFRVEELDEAKCCATLSLLRPDATVDFHGSCIDPTFLCDVTALERTRFCIEVDLKCFCAIQCLDPALVGPIDDRRHHCSK